MEIVRLYIRGEEKRGVVDRMVLEEGVGILGQVQGKEDRQVSVLPGEVRQALENMEEHGLCTCLLYTSVCRVPWDSCTP